MSANYMHGVLRGEGITAPLVDCHFLPFLQSALHEYAQYAPLLELD